MTIRLTVREGEAARIALGEDTATALLARARAEAAAAAAMLSEATAESVVGPTYASTAAGLAAVAEGDSFAVDNGDGTVTVHRKVSGAAVAQRQLATTGYLAGDGGAGAVGFKRPEGSAVAVTAEERFLLLPMPIDFGVVLDPTSMGLGTEVLAQSTTGSRNTGFGYQALQSNQGGSENTAFGYLALREVIGGADPVGNYNTAMGSFALSSLTTGYKNTAFGRAAADQLTTGYHNTALGYGSFHWATEAANCVAVGFEAVHGGAGATPLTAQGLTGVGYRALYAAVGDFNTALGTSAGAGITTGARNTALGVNALGGLVTGSDCTAIGYGAGLTATGSGNIFLGQGADAAAGLFNVTVIAAGVSATASNTFLLGNGQAILPGGAAADIGSQAKPWGFGIFEKAVYAHSGTAPPIGGATGKGFLLSSTPNWGIFFGSGVPTLSAARGSLYMRSDGPNADSLTYVNTDNGTTWQALKAA